MKTTALFGMMILVLASSFYACKKDIGNYDYTDANAITISTDMVHNDPLVVVAEDSVVIRQNDSLFINILLSQQKPSTDLSYKWMVIQSGSTLSNPNQYVVGNTRDLRTKITLVPNLYKLVVAVTDNTTGVTYYKIYELNVDTAPWAGEGWIVLQNQPNQNGADISVITTIDGSTPATVYSNVYSLSNNGRKLPLGTYSVNVLNYATTMRSQKISFLYPNGGLEVKSIDYSDSSVHSSWFLSNPTSYNLRNNAVMNSGQYEYIFNDDQVYMRRVNASSIKTPPIKFGVPILGTWSLAPFVVNNSGSEFYYTLYDQANKCFLLYNMETSTLIPSTRPDVANSHFLPYAGGAAALHPTTGAGFDLNNIRHNLVYTENAQPYTNATLHNCFFRNSVGDSTWLYQITASTSYANNFTTGRYFLNSARVPGINEASIFACPTYLAAPGKFYYVNNNNINLCTVASLANSSAAVAYSFPAGTVIKTMKVLKTGYAKTPSAESRTLVVATDETASGGGHKVYFLSLSATGTINNTPTAVYSGFDDIQDIKFKKKLGS